MAIKRMKYPANQLLIKFDRSSNQYLATHKENRAHKEAINIEKVNFFLTEI